MDVQLARCPPDAENSCRYFLKRLDTKLLEKHLEQCRNRTQHHSIKFSLDDVIVPEVVQVQAQHIEQSVGQQRKAVEKDFLRQRPSCKRRHFFEQHDHKRQSEIRC